jgi:hypothetical protein
MRSYLFLEVFKWAKSCSTCLLLISPPSSFSTHPIFGDPWISQNPAWQHWLSLDFSFPWISTWMVLDPWVAASSGCPVSPIRNSTTFSSPVLHWCASFVVLTSSVCLQSGVAWRWGYIARHRWLTSVILATWEICVSKPSGQIFWKTLSQKCLTQKMVSGVA